MSVEKGNKDANKNLEIIKDIENNRKKLSEK